MVPKLAFQNSQCCLPSENIRPWAPCPPFSLENISMPNSLKFPRPEKTSFESMSCKVSKSHTIILLKVPVSIENMGPYLQRNDTLCGARMQVHITMDSLLSPIIHYTYLFYLHNTHFFLNLLSLPSWSPSMRGIWFSRGSLNHGPGGLLSDFGRTKRRLNPIKRHRTARAHVPNDVNMKCILVRLFALH